MGVVDRRSNFQHTQLYKVFPRNSVLFKKLISMQLYTSTLLLLAGSTAALEWSSLGFGSLADVKKSLNAVVKEGEKYGFKFDGKSIENSVREGGDAYINSLLGKGLDYVSDQTNRDAVATRADAVDAEFTSRLDQAEAYKTALKSQAEEFRNTYGGKTVFKVKQGLNKDAKVFINGVENEHFRSLALELLKGTNSGVQKQFQEKTFGFTGRLSLDRALSRATQRAKQDALAELEAAKKKCNTYFGGVDCEEQVQAARTLVLSFDKLGNIESALDYGKKLMAKVEGVVERV